MKPKSLLAIWHVAGGKYYRVRNTRTLEDYLITQPANIMQGMPFRMEAISCEGKLFITEYFESYKEEWVLLSSKDEIEFLKTSATSKQAAFRVKCNYQKMNKEQESGYANYPS